MVSRVSAHNPGSIPSNRPSRTAMSVSDPPALSLALRTIRSSIAFSFRPQPPCKDLRPGATLGHRQWIQVKLSTEDLQDSWSAESSLTSAHARPSTELQPVDRAGARRTMNGPYDISFSHCLATTHDVSISRVLRDHALLLFRRTLPEQRNVRVGRDEQRLAGHIASRALQKRHELFSDGRS